MRVSRSSLALFNANLGLQNCFRCFDRLQNGDANAKPDVDRGIQIRCGLEVFESQAVRFCKIGDGGSFVSDGRIRLGGALPVNPDGGGLSSNHPGMRGIFLVIEATKQLRGECGERQVDGAQLACVHGTGGTLGVAHSGATLILGAES